MKDLLHFLITSVVEQKDKVKIEEEEMSNGVVNFKVKVAKEDMGKVIGKKGRIISAIRTLLKIRAIKEERMVNLELVEN